VRIKPITPACYVIEGDSGRDYTVYYNPRTRRWVCTCPDGMFRMRMCKHVRAVLSSRGGEP